MVAGTLPVMVGLRAQAWGNRPLPGAGAKLPQLTWLGGWDPAEGTHPARWQLPGHRQEKFPGLYKEGRYSSRPKSWPRRQEDWALFTDIRKLSQCLLLASHGYQAPDENRCLRMS